MSFREVTFSGFAVLFLAVFSPITYSYGAENTVQDSAYSNLQVSTFDVNATPPPGSALTYDPMINDWDMSLRAKGIVLIGAGKPIVMCSVDWIGISNESHDEFRKVLAGAAGTTPDRVVVHAIHQHDAPTSDFSAERLLKKDGIHSIRFVGDYAYNLLSRLDTAVRNAVKKPQAITHLGLGQAPVYKVASNRRILGADGKVKATRMSATKIDSIRAEPEGLIDPMVSLISFWSQEKPVAVLSYYASHPQSYYRTGIANPDFPAIARFLRQLAVPDALHVHFNGAGGNITAGKYNDGSKENRLILAERLADGMKRAWEATKREPVHSRSVTWKIEPLAFKPADYLTTLEDSLKSKPAKVKAQFSTKLAWLQRLRSGKAIDLACLGIGKARILHLPGEPFVEYQLMAKAVRPDLFVAVAGYGDYAPGYIGTAIAYQQGGYETGPVSGVNEEAEAVLMKAIHKLLHSQENSNSSSEK